MRKLFSSVWAVVGWPVAIVLFVWATVSAFSIFSDLKFLVDGWTWSVDQVPISIKAIALAIGKHVSGIVGGYREFVHGLVQMLHMPRLPQFVYDAAGVAGFSIGRGRWLVKRSVDRNFKDAVAGIELLAGAVRGQLDEAKRKRLKRASSGGSSPILKMTWRLYEWLSARSKREWRFPWVERLVKQANWFVATIVVYGGLVAIIIAALFGIDYLYRHFA